MSVNQPPHQLQQDLQSELIITKQLLDLISNELHQIKEFTGPGGNFETNVKENVDTMRKLSSVLLPNIDIENISPVRRVNSSLNQSVEE